MAEKISPMQFYEFVRTVIGNQPELMEVVFRASTDGLQQALERANQRAADKDMGMLSALALARGDRLGVDIKSALATRILAGVSKTNLAPVEAEFVSRHAPAFESEPIDA